MEGITFSVIIPTYNRDSTLKLVLDAILRQSMPAKEVIVVNDGGETSTGLLMDGYADPRIIYLEIANSGCTQVRRRGIEKATGNWLAFCDSDDIGDRDYLMHIADSIQGYGVDRVGLVATNYSVEGENSPRIEGTRANSWISKWRDDSIENESRARTHIMKHDFFLGLLEWQPLMHSAWCVSREVYDNVGGVDPTLINVRGEDAHLLRRIVANSVTVYCDESLVTLGRQGDNLSSSFVANLIGGAEILERLIDSPAIPEKYKSALHAAVIRQFCQISNQAFWTTNYEVCAKYTKRIPLKNRSLRHWRNRAVSALMSR